MNTESDRDSTGKEFLAPIGKLLGLTVVRREKGHATVAFEADNRYANPMGTLHGGVLCDIADAAMGMAYLSTLEPGESITSIELKINFTEAGAEAEASRRGESGSWWQTHGTHRERHRR